MASYRFDGPTDGTTYGTGPYRFKLPAVNGTFILLQVTARGEEITVMDTRACSFLDALRDLGGHPIFTKIS